MKTKRLLRGASAGFSLAELMVVVVIIALLATLVVQNVMPMLVQSNITKAQADITTMRAALDNWAIQNGGKYPDSLEVLVTPDENGQTFLRDQTTVPLDPWKNPYVYEQPVGGSPVVIMSYGADGQPGGEGEDSDISNITMKEGK